MSSCLSYVFRMHVSVDVYLQCRAARPDYQRHSTPSVLRSEINNHKSISSETRRDAYMCSRRLLGLLLVAGIWDQVLGEYIACRGR